MPPTCFRAVVVAILALTPATLLAQSGRIWRPEERVLISDFDDLGGVASDDRRVYAASSNGLEIYDFIRQRWEPPATVEDGYPRGERPSALAWDRALQELWLGTESGRLFAFSPHTGRWIDRGFVAGGPIIGLVFPDGMMDPVYVRVPSGWLRTDRSGFAPEPLPPGRGPELPRGAALPEDPFFRALGGTITLDRSLRQWPITGVARGAHSDDYWVATAGGNLFRYTDFAGDVSQLSYGLITRGATAVLATGEGVWFGGDGRGPRRGVVRADTALQQWDRWEARVEAAPAGAVRAILDAHDAVWVAAQDGVYRLGTGRARWQRLAQSDGLPSPDAGALLATPAGIWVGTRQGMALLTPEGRSLGSTAFRGTPVNRLALRGDTLWAATDQGLWGIRLGADGRPAAPAGSEVVPVAAHPALGSRVMAVLAHEGRLFAATPDALYVREGEHWSGPLRAEAAGLGRLLDLAPGPGALWVAGEAGVARLDLVTGQRTPFLVGDDLPAARVHGVAPAGDDVWVATEAGAMRLRWRW